MSDLELTMMRRVGELNKENARLKAEVERLRIAGSESEPRFVLLSDYRHLKAETDNLKAEVERLTAFTTRTIIPNEELQAQVERLTKAGDSLVYSLQWCDWGSHIQTIDGVNRWNAAKEGKGQP